MRYHWAIQQGEMTGTGITKQRRKKAIHKTFETDRDIREGDKITILYKGNWETLPINEAHFVLEYDYTYLLTRLE